MNQDFSNAVILKLDKENIEIFRDKLIKLYLKCFTTGKYAQYISEKDAEKEWKKYAEIGQIYVALQDEKLAGVLVAYPLKCDKDFPKQTKISIEKSIYIAELMTEEEFRGKGIGMKLTGYFLEKMNKATYSEVVIRVWDENIPALSLYKKLGFEETGISIQQTKYRSENKTFKMNKIYLIKHLNS
ncbi:GCN5-related N-acetyltransferase [uncultured Paludibacter sp.]|nr:GCN5-related N-acetyltransferase [uncultured Paludibacter sp.]